MARVSRILLLSSSLLFGLSLMGQTYVNRVYSDYSVYGEGRDLIQYKDHYLGLVYDEVVDSIYHNAFTLIELDTLGDIIKTYTFDPRPYTPHFYYWQYSQMMIEDRDSNIVVAGTKVFTSGDPNNNGIIIKLDKNIDSTLWVKTFVPKPYSGITLIDGIKVTPENNYCVWGYSHLQGDNHRTGYISLLDSDGNLKWSVFLPNTDTTHRGDWINDCVLGPDGKIAYANWYGHRDPPVPGSSTYTNYEISFGIIDTLGVLIGEWNIGGPFYDAEPRVSLSNDSNIILTYAKGKILDPNDPWPEPDINQTYWQINYMKLNWSGDTLLRVKYGKLAGDSCLPFSNDYISLQRLFLPMGHLLADSDSLYIWGHDYNQSQMMLLDENGDSIWHHTIRDDENIYPNDCQNYLKEGVCLWKLIPRVNGEGFVGFGKYYKTNSYESMPWFVYIDKYGCTEYNCSLGVEEQSEVSEQLNPLKVYPNPTSGKIQIDFSRALLNSYIRIYSIQGKFVKEEKMNSSKMEIDISDLPSGNYMITIWDVGQMVAREIVVKE